MQEEANIRHELAARLQNLPAEQIKLAVLKLLEEDEGNLEDLEHELSLEQFAQSSSVNFTSSKVNSQPELSPAQKAKAFREWAESHRRDLPPLSDEAISRESIYSNERL